MTRTTIYRSELAAFAATLALPLTALAQQPPAVQRPIQQAQQAGQQSPAAQQPAPTQRVTITSGPGAQQPSVGAPPATHTVAQGETLWALAQQFLGDPLLWPEIYRLNTNTIEDPHWIYPGEELRIAPDSEPAPTAAAPAPVTEQSFTVTPQGDTTRPMAQPAPTAFAPASGATVFSPTQARSRTATTIEQTTARTFRAVRDGEYYSAGFLTEGQPLNSGRVLGNLRRNKGSSGTTAQLFDDLIVSAPAGETLQRGDLLLAFRRGDEVGTWGQTVVPTGLLRARGAAGERFTATAIRLYGAISEGQEILHIQPFDMSSSRKAELVANGMTGRVIRLRDQHGVAQMQTVLFIDKGANDGVRLGDVFEIFNVRADEQNGGTVEQRQAQAVIVNTRAATSTAIIVELYRGDINPQSMARQVRRMPS